MNKSDRNFLIIESILLTNLVLDPVIFYYLFEQELTRDQIFITHFMCTVIYLVVMVFLAIDHYCSRK